ncbi:hypothetical protein F4703DRAFT_1009239 [Phycomyces blakesleeanus]
MGKMLLQSSNNRTKPVPKINEHSQQSNEPSYTGYFNIERKRRSSDGLKVVLRAVGQEERSESSTQKVVELKDSIPEDTIMDDTMDDTMDDMSIEEESIEDLPTSNSLLKQNLTVNTTIGEASTNNTPIEEVVLKNTPSPISPIGLNQPKDITLSDPRYHHKKGKRTRWDVGPILIPEDMECTQSFASLQLDDTSKALDYEPENLCDTLATGDCDACNIMNSQERGPLDQVALCESCKQTWLPNAKSLLDRLSKHSKDFVKPTQKQTSKQTLKQTSKLLSKQQKQPHQQDNQSQSQPQSKQKQTPKQTSKKTTKRLPPAKSVHLHSKKSSIQEAKNYYTTGAFLTRNTAKQLVDEAGFHPNPHGFTNMQKVKVLNINGHWYRGILTMMYGSKVKVHYLDWDDQEEWIVMGSRRLRGLTKDEEEEDEDANEEEDGEDAAIENENKGSINKSMNQSMHLSISIIYCFDGILH